MKKDGTITIKRQGHLDQGERQDQYQSDSDVVIKGSKTGII